MRKKLKRFAIITALAALIMAVPSYAFDIGEKLLEPFTSWICDRLRELLEMFAVTTLEIYGTDLDTFFNGLPFAQVIQTTITQIGLVAMLSVVMIVLVRQFLEPLGFRSENPVRLVLNTLILAPVVYLSVDISEWILGLFSKPYQAILNVEYSTDVLKSFTDILQDIVNVVVGSMGSVVVVIFYLIVLIVFGMNYLRFVAEIVERYIVVGFLVICAPLAVAFMPSESTRGITVSWFKMLIGQGFMLILQAIVMRLFTSSLVMATHVI